jgi:hypothetical protein
MAEVNVNPADLVRVADAYTELAARAALICPQAAGRPTVLAGSIRADVDANIENMTIKNQSRGRSRSGIGTAGRQMFSLLGNTADVDMRGIVSLSVRVGTPNC